MIFCETCMTLEDVLRVEGLQPMDFHYWLWDTLWTSNIKRWICWQVPSWVLVTPPCCTSCHVMSPEEKKQHQNALRGVLISTGFVSPMLGWWLIDGGPVVRRKTAVVFFYSSWIISPSAGVVFCLTNALSFEVNSIKASCRKFMADFESIKGWLSSWLLIQNYASLVDSLRVYGTAFQRGILLPH